MRGHSPVFANSRQVATGNTTIKLKRGGPASSGSGPTGYKHTARALLARALADRPGVSIVVKDRQAATVARKANPPAVIWPGPLADCDRHFYHD